ncbi:glyoxalase family protein [Ophiocordyceps camponoti-floridani]|uniref:Glyoxalase family protein n=1 Tax=Ophiocordyceps camponoti-floridani TaxID=2030778 RepID=A0A8H4Q7A3_9HYPO|nr:glyoxalase family protein [Ophiocordyceps camponoti-floridani]
MAIDHTCLAVPKDKFRECLNIYLEALKPLGYEIRHQYGETVIGLGAPDKHIPGYQQADFWLVGIDASSSHGLHLAFTAPDRPTVDAFYTAAIKAGAKDNGAPGVRTMYHPNYYGAFILDPAGNNLEAVCHSAP